jgi:hypothetical protein
MKMREYEQKEVVKMEKVLKTIKCDTCKKDINETDHDFYYEVFTSHSLWGNDSIDSLDEFDFCSWECLTVHQGRYFAHADDTYEYRIEQVGK